MVTPNLHVCFGFYYHYPELRPHLHLLTPKSTQADGWEKSHTEIQALAPDRLKEFQQFIIACYVTSLNNFPDLDPIVWAESNSFSYTYREMNPLQGVYRFTKDE